MSIRHGVYIQEEATAVQVPKTGNSSVQVVVGTAPVNMAENPSEAVNVPILANSGTEAMAALGYSVDFKNFTLCQTMFATSNLFQVSPVVYINVLDPAKHNKELAEAEYQVNQKQAVIEKEGIILEGLTVKNSTGDTELKAGEDYSAAFDSTTGFLTITMLAGGKGAAATAIKVSGKVIDPSKVTKEDVIGAVDPATGAETGAQVIRQVYPRLGIVPGLILAPGWSQIPEVGLALAAKAAKINGVYSAMALLDLDTAKAKKYTDTKSVKEESGYTSPFCYPLWPCDRVGRVHSRKICSGRSHDPVHGIRQRGRTKPVTVQPFTRSRRPVPRRWNGSISRPGPGKHGQRLRRNHSDQPERLSLMG